MKKLNTRQTDTIEVLRESSELRPELDALKKGESLLISTKEWRYKSAPRTLIYDLAGRGKFSVKLTADKKSWLVKKLT